MASFYRKNAIVESGKIPNGIAGYKERWLLFRNGMIGIELKFSKYFDSTKSLSDRNGRYIILKHDIIDNVAWLEPFKIKLPKEIKEEIIALFERSFS